MTPVEIRRLRGALGMRQDQLGALLGMHSATISRWESSVSPIRPDAWQVAVLSTIGDGIRHRPAAVDDALGFLSEGRAALALGALLGPAVAAARVPRVPITKPRSRPRVRLPTRLRRRRV